MSRLMLAVVLGTLLGLLDGVTAWFTEAARPYFGTILIQAVIRGVGIGLLTGLMIQRRNSLGLSILLGLLSGLAVSFLAAWLTGTAGEYYFLDPMLPGAMLGMIVGYAGQKYGKE